MAANFNPAAAAFMPGNAIRFPNVYPGFPNGPRFGRPQQLTMTQNGVVHRNINANYVPGMIAMTSNMANNPRFNQMQMQMQMRMPTPIYKQNSGIAKLLAFVEWLGGDVISNNNLNLQDIQYWKNLTHTFFSEDVTMKYTLFHGVNKTTRRFELAHQVIPRFYQTFFESGVIKIQLILGCPKERLATNIPNSVSQVECPLSSVEYHFENGIQVTTSGRLMVHFNNSLKMTSFDFVTTKFIEYVPRDSIQRYPPNTAVVNEYGIPPMTMRCLEIAEGVDYMQEVIALTIKDSQTGPLQAFRVINQTPISDNPNLNQRIPNPQAQLNVNDIKNEPSNYSGAPPTPNTSDLQAPAPTPTATPTPAPTPTQTPSPLASNVTNVNGINSPRPKNFSPASSEQTLKRGIDGVQVPKKRRSLQHKPKNG